MQQCVETLLQSQEIPTSSGLYTTSIPNTSSFESSPEEWIRNNVVTKNMLLKTQFLSRLGRVGTRILDSMSQENKERMSRLYAHERKQRDEEDEEYSSSQTPVVHVDRSYSNAEGDFFINFMKKTDDEIRQAYINRLINMKILKLEPAQKHQTMIIFDWDDTLLCTNFLAKHGYVDLPDDILITLQPLDESASTLLSKAVQYGQTFIITNAAEGWVQCSSKLFLPKTYQVIMQNKIKVISARTGYEDQFPGDSHRWKIEAFLDIERYFNKNLITNLLCLGDSHIEMDAAYILAERFNHSLIKTIKFKRNPKPEELVKQQNLVSEKLDKIYLSYKNLTIRLEQKNPTKHLNDNTQ